VIRRTATIGVLFLLAATPLFANADRIVAERVLRLGGAVILEGRQRPIRDLQELPDTDFRIRTLDLVGVSIGAWGLKDELSRLPVLPHLKELYLNGRLWYNQPPLLVADTIGLFAACTGLEKLVLSKPVQTYIPLEDPVLQRLASVPGISEMRLHQTRFPGSTLAPFTIVNPNSLQNDFALTRTFKISAAQSVQFRWEVFNLINRVNFNAPVTSLNSASFGQIQTTATSGGDPRIMQFALKFTF